MSVQTDSIVTLEEAKEFLDIEGTKGTLDSKIKIWIPAATKQLETASRACFTKQQFVEYFTSANRSGGNNPQRIHLCGVPVDETQSFEISYDPARAYSSNLTKDQDYFIDPDKSIVTLAADTVYSFNSIRVTYTGGFESTSGVLTDAPDNLKLACLLQIGFLKAQSRKDNIGLTGDRTDSRRSATTLDWQKSGGLAPQAANLLLPYHRLLAGRR